MKISKITINNFNSIGAQKNVLNLENDVTALIGKNESGKSSVIDAINSIRFTSKLPNLSKNVNRRTDTPVSFTVELFFLEVEAEKYGLVTANKTVIEITDEKIVYDGELSKLFSEGADIHTLVNSFCTTVEDYSNLPHTSALVSFLSDLDKKLPILPLENMFNSCIKELSSQRDIDKNMITELTSKARNLLERISGVYFLLPNIYKYTGLEIKDTYQTSEIANHISGQTPIRAIEALFWVAEVEPELLHKAIASPHPGTKDSAQDELKALVEKNINAELQKFYQQSDVQLKIFFDGNTIKFNIDSGLRMNLSEQSDGLKWYFSLFIDMCRNGLHKKPTLLLLDEPGVHLHVDAQSELIKLFYHLTERGNSLIYTTHSPFMLDSSNPTSIRIIQKPSGFTEIVNKYYSDEIDGSSKKETLSPLLKGIGATLSNTIFPLFDKPCLIVEGITDKLYIDAMMGYLYSENEPSVYIVPSVGASNIDKLASIFIGWGIEFSVLLDFDKDGFKEYKELASDLHMADSLIRFVNLGQFADGVPKDEYREIESLISVDVLSKLDSWNLRNSGKEISKYIIANDFYTKAKEQAIALDDETIQNFRKLFSALFKSDTKDGNFK